MAGTPFDAYERACKRGPVSLRAFADTRDHTVAARKDIRGCARSEGKSVNGCDVASLSGVARSRDFKREDGDIDGRVFLHHPWTLAMTQPDRQPRSGLATIRRDFSSNKTVDPSPAPSLSVSRRSTLSDSLRKAIQDGVASREAEKAAHASSSYPQKHGLSADAVSQPKKRRLPSSWTDSEQSSSTSYYGSSQSSLFSTASTLRSDFTPHSYQDPVVHAQPSKPVPKPDIQLSHEQKQILELVKQKQNIFYTGSAGMSSVSSLLSTAKVPVSQLRDLSLALVASRSWLLIWSGSLLPMSWADLSPGTGKSVLLREIIKTLRKEYVKTPDAVAVTASTGD